MTARKKPGTGKTVEKVTRRAKSQQNKEAHVEAQKAAPGTKEALMATFAMENAERRATYEEKVANGTVQMEDRFNEVLSRIGDEGLSTVEACMGVVSRSWFRKYRDDDKDRQASYARAEEDREELYFYLVEAVAFNRGQDHTPFTGGNVVARDKVIIDTLKWKLARMNPKKYGDKLDVDHTGDMSVTIDLGDLTDFDDDEDDD